MTQEISYEDFAKLDIRIGTIVAAEMVPDADKLIKCTVDFGLKPSADADGSADHPSMSDGLGERDMRTIVSGIAEWKKPEELVGKQFPYIVNLAPRVLRGVKSEGMLLAVGIDEGVVLLEPERSVSPGTKLR